MRPSATCRHAILRAAILVGLTGFGVPPAARAATLAGVTMPDTLTVEGSHLQLNGMGVRSFTFLHIHGYVAGLYVTTPTHLAQSVLDQAGPKLVRIIFVHAAGQGRVAGEMRDGRKRLCADGCPPADDVAFAQLLTTARAVQKGDSTTYVFTDQGVLVRFDGEDVAMIHNPDFARRMLAGMIGEHPPTEELRRGLLGF